MKAASSFFLAAILLATLFTGLQRSRAQGTAFTYQGDLTANGGPASGIYNLEFTLFPTNVTGNAIAGPVTNTGVAVTNGLFTTLVDFGGGAFTGGSNWLEIAICSNNSSVFNTLSPRQQITPTPYALMAGSASNLLGPVSASQLSGSSASAVSFVNPSNTFSGNGAVAWQNANTTQTAQSDIGYLATNNTATTVITLPASPNVGDVIRVAGIGAGGWEIAQNASQTIIADDFIFTKAGGLLWTAAYTGSASTFGNIAMSTDGNLIVADNAGGTTTYSSDSGVSWTVNSTGSEGSDMAANSSASQLVTVGNSHAYISFNAGVSWSLLTTPSGSWTSVAASSDGGVIYIAGGTAPMYVSRDNGNTWATNNMGTQGWSHLACSADGSCIAAVAGSRIYYSGNYGSTVSYTNNVSTTYSDVVVSPSGGVFATAGSTLYLITGATTDSTFSMPGGANSIAFSSTGSRVVMAGDNILALSVNFGQSWTTTTAPLFNWTGVASSATGGRFAATGNGDIYTAQPTTTPGTSGHLVGQEGSAVELQYLGNNVFLPLSSQGIIAAY